MSARWAHPTPAHLRWTGSGWADHEANLTPAGQLTPLERLDGIDAYEAWRAAQPPETFDDDTASTPP